MPRFYKNKEIEREKLKEELIKRRYGTELANEVPLTERQGERKGQVMIDDQTIDLYGRQIEV